MKQFIKGANPYLPLWEHIPDGEPKVFEYNNETRVYIYGSHDTLITQYCGTDQVVWSAPIDDLTNWRYDGVCYEAADHSVLYAPDVVQKGDTFYMYAAEAKGSRIMVAKSKNPAGPFTDPVQTELGFDPGVFVDDDGRVYAYWGFCKSYCAELNEDMATIKSGTLKENPIGHCFNPFIDVQDEEHIDPVFSFFEASSLRKVDGEYIYIYSKRYDTPVPEYGIDFPCNGFLSYAYSDEPLGEWTYGGDISFNGGNGLTKEDGTNVMTYPWGNNHGSILKVKNQWFVFYHRQTGTNEYSRQGMIEPIDVCVAKDGRVFLGIITRDENGEPISQKPAEMTSQGAHIHGMDAYKNISAGYACFIYGGIKRAYIKPVYEREEDISSPVTDLTDGCIVGFRYLQFGNNSAKSVTISVKTQDMLTVHVKIDSPDGEEIATIDCRTEDAIVSADLNTKVTGKHAIYFAFESDNRQSVAEFDFFSFD